MATKLIPRVIRTMEYLFLFSWVGFSLLAFTWVVVASLKTNQEFFGSIWSLPAAPQFQNYVSAVRDSNIGRNFVNTIVVIAVAVIVLLAISAPAAYTLSRIKFRGVNWIATLFVLGIGVPVQVFVIPLFFLMVDIGLADSLAGLTLVYVVTALPFTIFLLRAFFATLPTELEEAADIDGCTRLTAFWWIMLPLARSGLITAAIFNVIFMINDFLLALTLLHSNKNFTLSLGLYGMYSNMRYTGDWVSLFAGFTLIMLPSLAVYLLLSRHIIAGLTMGATKG